MKIIFLDFDGVITSLKSKWCLMPDKMDLIRRICEETDAKIVISSSWRMADLKNTISYITCPTAPYVDGNPYSLVEFTIGVTKFLYKWDYIKECGDKSSRGEEIKEWLDSHPNVEDYIILDDDGFDFYDFQLPHYIETSYETGISEDDVEKAIKYFKKSS